jgi:hypothetical protein
VYDKDTTYNFSDQDCVAHVGYLWHVLQDDVINQTPPEWPSFNEYWAPVNMTGIGPPGPIGPKGDIGGAVIHRGSDAPDNIIGGEGDLYFRQLLTSNQQLTFTEPGHYEFRAEAGGHFRFDLAGAEGSRGNNRRYPT